MAKKNADAPAPARRRSTTAARSVAPNAATQREPTHEEIAEAAYRRYLNRGGRHGQDFDDWLEAERELRSGEPVKSQ